MREKVENRTARRESDGFPVCIEDRPRQGPQEQAACHRVAPGDPDEWLSPREAALLLGLSTRSLERRRVAGAWPPFVRLSRQVVRYQRATLRQGPPSEAVHVS